MADIVCKDNFFFMKRGKFDNNEKWKLSPFILYSDGSLYRDKKRILNVVLSKKLIIHFVRQRSSSVASYYILIPNLTTPNDYLKLKCNNRSQYSSWVEKLQNYDFNAYEQQQPSNETLANRPKILKRIFMKLKRHSSSPPETMQSSQNEHLKEQFKSEFPNESLPDLFDIIDFRKTSKLDRKTSDRQGSFDSGFDVLTSESLEI